jgi:hypothetical protein
MMNRNKAEKIAAIVLLGILVCIFFYQVAYGMTMGPNGTMTVTNSTNGLSATFRAPPGTNVTNFGIISEQTPTKWTNFTNSTWTMYNGSSGSASTITFKTIPRGYTDGDFTMGMNITTFVRTLNGHTHEGILGDDNGLIYSTDTSFQLCNNKWRIESGGLYHLGCQEWKILTINPSHMEFTDQHGAIIHLIR